MQFELKIVSDDLTEIEGVLRKLKGDPASASVNAEAVFAQPTPAPVAAPTPIPNAAQAPVATAPVLAPVAPAPSVDSTTDVGAAEELDSEGFPWDGRIHSSSKAKLAKNNAWKLIRGVEKSLVTEVKNEYRAKGYGNGASFAQDESDDEDTPAPAPVVPAMAPPPLPAAAPTPPVVNPANAVVQKVLAAIAAKDVEGAWVLAFINAHGVAALNDLPSNTAATEALEKALKNLPLMKRVNALVSEGKLTQEWVAQLLTGMSVADMNALLVDDEKVQHVDAFLTQHGL